jgi:hypothetical protein
VLLLLPPLVVCAFQVLLVCDACVVAVLADACGRAEQSPCCGVGVRGAVVGDGGRGTVECRAATGDERVGGDEAVAVAACPGVGGEAMCCRRCQRRCCHGT